MAAQIGRRLIIEHSGAIVIHGHVVIGDDCITRQGDTIGNPRTNLPLETPHIGSRGNIGASAKIPREVQIGDDAEVGASALAEGVPACLVCRC